MNNEIKLKMLVKKLLKFIEEENYTYEDVLTYIGISEEELTNLLYGKDDEVTTICYNDEKKWNSRNDAVSFFKECYYASEGSERERYANILMQLSSGRKICKDTL